MDKPRLHLMAAGGVVAMLLLMMHMIPVVFAEPPHPLKAVLRALLTKVVGGVAAVIAAVYSAPWAADLFNGAIGILPFKSPVTVDPITAAAVVAVITMTLIADPTARQKLFEVLRTKVMGVSA